MIRPADQPAPKKPSAAEADPLGREAWRAVRRKAKRLVVAGRFAAADREDLEQELAIRLWQGLSSYDPALGSLPSFIATILHRAAATLCRSRCSVRRGSGAIRLSWDAMSADATGSIEEAMTSARAPLSHHEAFELAHDVAVVIETLPEELKRLARQLKRLSVTEIAQRQGVSRSLVYTRIHALRARFVAAGFEKISPRRRTLRAQTAKVIGRETHRSMENATYQENHPCRV